MRAARNGKHEAPPNPSGIPDPLAITDGNARLVVVRYLDPETGMTKLMWRGFGEGIDISTLCDMASDVQADLRLTERRAMTASLERLRTSYDQLTRRRQRKVPL